MYAWIMMNSWILLNALFGSFCLCPHLFRIQIHQNVYRVCHCWPIQQRRIFRLVSDSKHLTAQIEIVQMWSIKSQVPSPQSHIQYGSYQSKLVGPFWRYFPNEIGNIWNSFLSHILFLATSRYIYLLYIIQEFQWAGLRRVQCRIAKVRKHTGMPFV